VDLDLASTLLRRAEIQLRYNLEISSSALAKIRVALSSIRLLEIRIEDPRAWQDIHKQAIDLEQQADDLESALNSLLDEN
jgi:FtsZ-binding cell division protein ZapB